MNIILRPRKDLTTQRMLKQIDIPCLSKVSQTFEIVFESPLPAMVGVVEDWDRKLLAERAPAGAGGEYIYHRPSLICLREMAEELFQIVHLKMFYDSFGWLKIIENGEYAKPVPIWDEDV
jgi:hypothetical protein